MNWFIILSTLAFVLFIVYLCLDQKSNKKIRISKWIIFCIATLALGSSAIIRIKEALLQNDTAMVTVTLETVIIIFCIILLGIGITGLKTNISNNQDSQK